MNKINFEGTIETGDHSIILELIEAWLGKPDVKIRIMGEELVYKDDIIYIYAHNPVIDGVAVDEFIIEGSYNGDLDAMRKLLEHLSSLCKSRQIKLEMEYVQLNADGNPISKEYEL